MNIATVVGAPSSVTLSAPSASASRYPERRPAPRLSRGLTAAPTAAASIDPAASAPNATPWVSGSLRRSARCGCQSSSTAVNDMPSATPGHHDHAHGHGAHELVARGGHDLRHLPAHRYGPPRRAGAPVALVHQHRHRDQVPDRRQGARERRDAVARERSAACRAPARPASRGRPRSGCPQPSPRPRRRRRATARGSAARPGRAAGANPRTRPRATPRSASARPRAAPRRQKAATLSAAAKISRLTAVRAAPTMQHPPAADQVRQRAARHLEDDATALCTANTTPIALEREPARLRRDHEERQHQPDRQPPERPEQDEAAREPAGGHAASRRSGNAWKRTIARSVSSRRVRRSA